MFKGIIAAKQAEAPAVEAVQEFTVEQAVEMISGLEELHAADVAAAERQETVKNARALRAALEQYGTDATATRALLAFADADGQLSAAFGVKHEGALESVDDTQILVDAATIAGGLESYILGEEQDEASVEGWRELLSRNKKALTVLAGTAGAIAGSVAGDGKGGAIGLAAGVSLGGVLYIANKIANKGFTDGNAEAAEKMIARIETSLKIISAASTAGFTDDPEKAAAAVKGLVGKVEGDAKELGMEIVWDDKHSKYKVRGLKGIVGDSVKPKMVKFEESGWTPEKFKAAAADMKKVCLEVGAVCTAADKKLLGKIGSDGSIDIDPQLMFVFDLVDVASTEARYTLNQLTRTVKSAGKFFTDKKPEEGSEEPKSE